MPYTLTLTHGERQAIDWVGERYSNGRELYTLLWVDCQQSPDDVDWDDKRDITFTVPENVAWLIKDNADCEGYWPCFSDELSSKMQTLIDRIV